MGPYRPLCVLALRDIRYGARPLGPRSPGPYIFDFSSAYFSWDHLEDKTGIAATMQAQTCIDLPRPGTSRLDLKLVLMMKAVGRFFALSGLYS